MATLTLALAAALVSASAPEGVSGETVQALDFKGLSYGTFADASGQVFVEWEAMDGHTKELTFGLAWRCRDDGGGRFTVRAIGGLPWRGIYKVRGNCITVCVIQDDRAYPTSFSTTKEQWVLTFCRIKPGK